ncbi:MAG: hypothetical protein ACJAY9_001746 [Flavobacteriales bacterium]|jgi:uncharacterized protein (TIGR02145 family)
MTKIILISLSVFVMSCNKEENDPIEETTPDSTTISSTAGAGVTDADGNTYSTIILRNGQEWMAENLSTTKYCNGDSIPNITNDVDWQNLTSGAWAYYNNDSLHEIPYGKLYNGYATEDARNICPCGWQTPTNEEWLNLTAYIGGYTVSGGKMKSTGNIDDADGLWSSPNTEASNSIGFSGLPGGLRDGDATFVGISDFGCWVGTECSIVFLDYDSPATEWGVGNGKLGVSVRCLKD